MTTGASWPWKRSTVPHATPTATGSCFQNQREAVLFCEGFELTQLRYWLR